MLGVRALGDCMFVMCYLECFLELCRECVALTEYSQ